MNLRTFEAANLERKMPPSCLGGVSRSLLVRILFFPFLAPKAWFMLKFGNGLRRLAAKKSQGIFTSGEREAPPGKPGASLFKIT